MTLERGQATVELALCLPLLALLLAAVVEIGLVAADQARLWHAAREAARVAIVETDVGSAREAANSIGLKGVHVEVSPPPAYRRQGDPLVVKLTYRPRARVSLLEPVIRRFRLEARATMRIETP